MDKAKADAAAAITEAEASLLTGEPKLSVEEKYIPLFEETTSLIYREGVDFLFNNLKAQFVTTPKIVNVNQILFKK